MLSHRPHGGTYDKSNNFLGLKGVLCNVCYVVIVNIDVVSMILHKINILFEILKFTLLRKVLQNRTPVRTLTGRIGGCKKGLKMAVCMEKCILFYWCWSRRLICSTLEPTFFILLKQTAAMIFLNFFFLKSEVGWEGGCGVLHGYLDLFSHTPLPLGPTTGAHNPFGLWTPSILEWRG